MLKTNLTLQSSRDKLKEIRHGKWFLKDCEDVSGKKSLLLALKWKIFQLIFMSQFCILDWQIPFLISTNSETLPLARDYNLFILFIKNCAGDVAEKRSWGSFSLRREAVKRVSETKLS